jgi:hypothetical protein
MFPTTTGACLRTAAAVFELRRCDITKREHIVVAHVLHRVLADLNPASGVGK